jgi:integrase
MTQNHAWSEPIDAWLRWQQAGGARKATLQLRSWQLQRLARDHPDRKPVDLGPDDLTAWLTSADWSRETLRSHRSAVRGFYGWLTQVGQIAVDPARYLRPVKPGAVRARAAGETTINAALLAADDRLTLMLLLGSRAGLRRGEIARVKVTDLVAEVADWSLRISGKGGVPRTIPVSADIARRIAALPGPYAFPGRFEGHLSAAHVGKLLKRAMDGATTAHQLRHRYATTLYRATHDIESVRRLVGHASIATTQRYISVDDDRLREVARFAG